MKMKSIKAKILSIVLAILFLSLGTVSAVFSVLSVKNTESTVYKIMEETSQTSALAIENRLLATKSAINEIGTVSRLSNPKIPVEDKLAILDSKTEHYKLILMDVSDKAGKTLRGENLSGTEAFEKAIKGETYVSSPQLDGSNQIIVVTAPLWKDGIYGTTPVGVVYAKIDSMFLSRMVEKINIGESGVALILDEKGTTIAFKDEQVVAQQENMIEAAKTDPKLKDLAEIEQKALNGEPSNGEYIYNKTDFLGFFSPIEGTKWVMGISVEKFEFMKQIYVTATVCLIISAIFFVIAALMIIRFTVKITAPITEIEQAAKKMAEGDYNVSVTYKSDDELGNLADSMRTMVIFTKDIIEDASRGLEKLAEGYFDLHRDKEYPGVFKPIENSILDIALALSQTLGNIKVSAEQVNAGAEQVSASAQTLAEGSSEQASSIEELSAAINEISDKIQKNASNAQKVNDITSKVGSELENSNQKMQKMMGAIDDISDKSVEINKIIKVIEDIAFQTNILALNAAVEAARAGTAGKGFAVVADEVRNLAGKSAEAVKNTTSLIEDTVRSVNEGTNIAKETAEAMSIVAENAEQVVSAVEEITEASRAQATTIAQITNAVNQISSVVQANSATAEESAAASEELSSQSSILQEEISKFTLKEGLEFNEIGY